MAEKRICGSKKRGGGICTSPFVMENGRCRFHGGLTPKGTASPHYKNGQYSKYLKGMPKSLRVHFNGLTDDPEYTGLRDDLALQTAFIRQLLSQMEKEKAPPWGQAVEALNDYKVALRAKRPDEADQKEKLRTLEQVLREGVGAAANERSLRLQVLDVIDRKTRTAAAEWRRLTDMAGVVTVEDALAFATALIEIQRRVVKDPDTLRRLNDEIFKMLPPPLKRPPVQAWDPTTEPLEVVEAADGLGPFDRVSDRSNTDAAQPPAEG